MKILKQTIDDTHPRERLAIFDRVAFNEVFEFNEHSVHGSLHYVADWVRSADYLIPIAWIYRDIPGDPYLYFVGWQPDHLRSPIELKDLDPHAIELIELEGYTPKKTSS